MKIHKYCEKEICGYTCRYAARGPLFRAIFLANVNVLRYVCYMLSAVRLSVCLLSVTLVHPTQAVELFGNFFHHTIAQGLYFSGAKNRWWGTPLSP